mmetsp:Transcript_5253/g.12581  ORF Transcript_5253/g.12581 Transcript_5253/m.12581 type:complete len:217 (+) Transcript_5253:362-1012(+)
MDLQDLHSSLLVGQRDLHLSIQSTRSQQGGVQGVGAVRGHDDLDPAQVVEAVQLVQKFHQSSLDLSVCRGALGESLAANGIDLVHEDDARLMFLGIAEHLSDDTGALSDVLVDDGTGHDLDEASDHVVRHGPGQQGLACARRSVEQDSLGCLDAHALEELWVCEGQLDDLTHLTNLLGEATDFVVRDLAWVLVKHAEDHRIDLAGELPHDGQSGHV